MRRPSWPAFVGVFLLAASMGSACSGSLAATPLPMKAGDWRSPLERDHALVGRIYEVAGDRTATQAELGAALAGADVVLLGEQHDNFDHHRLQTLLLEGLLAAGRRPAIAFEQINLEQQATVDSALARRDSSGGADAAARATTVAEVLGWEKSGWPPFDQYRSLFETALGAGLPIRAANLSRASMMALFAHGDAKTSATRLSPSASAWTGPALPDDVRASMVAEIEDSHCGYADEGLVATMLEAQRRRDDAMAEATAGAQELSRLAAGGDAARAGAVLVCGFGHARKDFGVPLSLRRQRPALRVVSLAFLEVFPDGRTPADYARVLHAAALPFDYVIFTPRVDDEDPCEKFRAGLEKMKKR